MNTRKTILVLCCISGMLAVMIGAFGAHGLEDIIPDRSLSSYKTAVAYQFYHSLAALLSLILIRSSQPKSILPATLFLIGNLLFCGSIYILTTRSITHIESTQWIGPLTPVGGIFYILAWGSMALLLYKQKN